MQLPCSGCGIPWCAPKTRTYIIIKTGWRAVNQLDIANLLHAAWVEAGATIENFGNRVMVAMLSQGGWTFHWDQGHALKLIARNANNRQIGSMNPSPSE